MAEEHARLLIQNNNLEFPIIKGTLGPEVIQIAELIKAGYFTFDPGFLVTASCESKITFINGNKGQLLYRGYPIEQIAEKCDYLETCYLLLNSELPSPPEKNDFVNNLKKNLNINSQLKNIFSGFPSTAHPMSMLLSTVGALSSFYHDKINVHDLDSRNEAAMQLIAKVPVLAAMCYRHTQSKPFVNPETEMGYTENFLNMLFHSNTNSKPNPILVNAMDKIFILHADHEQNASTSTVRLAGSSGADPFTCIAAGIASLWGPAHGGGQ